MPLQNTHEKGIQFHVYSEVLVFNARPNLHFRMHLKTFSDSWLICAESSLKGIHFQSLVWLPATEVEGMQTEPCRSTQLPYYVRRLCGFNLIEAEFNESLFLKNGNLFEQLKGTVEGKGNVVFWGVPG